MKSLFSLLILLLFSLSTFAAAPLCRSLFREKVPGYFQFSEENQQIGFVSTDIKKPQFSGSEVGRLDFDFFDSTNTLYIAWVDVHPQFREHGVSTQLIEEVLRRYPETEKIAGYLTNKNLEVYEDVLGKTYDHVQALKATPYYHSFSAMGFSEIISSDHFDGKVTVALKQPKSMP